MLNRAIAHYRILDKLGEGGMGAVYRARDTHLDRSVAIKILPPEAVADPERKRRFVQEAKAASALNHPNIVTIHDIDNADGVDFIVMECVRGKTLGALIGKRGMPVGEALHYGIQMAGALAAAHAIGIVHRDLKPANIMVTQDQRSVKVLDFGVAKLSAGDDSGLSSTDTTQTYQPQTSEGKIFGTLAYMSPEQALGKKVDARSDIFSFGAVLYEMLSGRRAFQGDTKLSVLSAVLHEEPKPLEGVPRELGEVVGLCLRKDLSRRLQHMDDLKLVLENIKEHCDAAPASPRKRRPLRWMAVAGLLALIAALGLWRLVRPGAPDVAASLTRLTWDSGLTDDPALSLDGKFVAYASDRYGEGNLDIWVQQLSGGEPVRLTSHPADDITPSFSPDSSRVVFRSDRDGGGIYVVSALGGQERLIAKGGQDPRFSPDSERIVYWVGEPTNFAPSAKVYLVPSTGGKPMECQPGFADARYPVWTPDGGHVLFQGMHSAGEQPDWWVAPVQSGSCRGPAVKTGAFEVFRHQGLSVHMGPGGFQGDNIVFSANVATARSIYRVPISRRNWKLSGTPHRLTFGTGLDAQPFPGSEDRLVFVSLTLSNNVWLLPVDGRGQPEEDIQRVTQGNAYDATPSCSRDGKRVVFTSGLTGNRDVWLKDLKTGREAALTLTPSDEVSPVISADGSKVAYSLSTPAASPIFILGLAMPPGSSVPEKVCDDCGEPVGWSPDGSKILYIDGQPRSVNLLNVATGQKTPLLRHSRYSLDQAQFSPDGAWMSVVAYTGPNQTRVFAFPFRDGVAAPEDQWIPITDGESWDDRPRWSPDGGLIYYYSKRDGFGCIWRQALDPTTRRPVGPPSAVHHFHSSRLSIRNMGLNRLGISVASDKLIFNLLEVTANVWMMQSGLRQD